ncbi:hypothetical protein PG989_008439 [Apiospora arundinis]
MPPLGKCVRLAAVALSFTSQTVWGQSNKFIVTGLSSGVNTATGQRPVRQNVNTFAASGGPQWDLFILGLQAFQAAPESDQLSYFGIAGIHGRPFVAWNGVNAVPGGSGGGFCPHGEIMFPAWHRPYVAAYEQVLGSYVAKVAANYTGSNAASYQAAAQTWRLPFWDWAADPALPPSASTPTITVNGPGGQVTIENPLYRYKWQRFPLNHANNYFPTNTDYNCWGWPTTTRQPNSQGVDQLSIVNQQLSTDPSPLKDQVVSCRRDIAETSNGSLTNKLQYLVMSSVTDFNTMASSGTAGTSFEDPHNDVHNSMYAIMSSLDYSGFDPIFFLHHAQIDRLIALWQAINYNNTVMTGSYRTRGLYATAAGTSITADTDLKPFYRDANNFHTGRTASTTKNFGYSYPEISNDWSLSKDQLRTSVIRSVNILYGDGSLAGNPASSSSSPSSTPSSAPPSSPSPSPTSTAVQQQQQPTSNPVTSQQPMTAASTPAQPTTTTAVNNNPGGNGGGGGGWNWWGGWPWGGWDQWRPGPPSAPAAPAPAKGQGPPAPAKAGPRGKLGKRHDSSFGGASGAAAIAAVKNRHVGKAIRRRGCSQKPAVPAPASDSPAPSPVNNAAAGYSDSSPTTVIGPTVTVIPTPAVNAEAVTPPPFNSSRSANTTTLYALTVQVERSDLPLPCSIIFALGSQTAGQMTVLSMPAIGLTHSQIPLKRAIGKLGLTDEIDRDDGPSAIAKLTSILQASIRMANGTIVTNPKVPSLKIQVQAQSVEPAASIDHFPIYSEPLKGPTVSSSNSSTVVAAADNGGDKIVLLAPVGGANLTTTKVAASAAGAAAAAALNGTAANNTSAER